MSGRGARLIDLELAEAAAAGRADLAAALLARGANPRAAVPMDGGHPEGSLATPLILAAAAGSAAMVELLLPLSDPRFSDSTGNTALTHAAWHGHAECVELLIPASDLNARAGDGLSALSCAAFVGAPDCVKILLKAGADPAGALLTASELGTAACAELLIPASRLDELGEGGLRALEIAAREGHGEIADAIRSEMARREARSISDCASHPPQGKARPQTL